jgi:hemerythrin-like metal-binding protein
MPWHPSFATHLPDQDAQHQYFVQLLDQLDIACQLDHSATIDLLLAELQRYAQYHFGCEELLMAAYNYPAEIQKREHRLLLSQLDEMMKEHSYSRAKIRLFVYKWLTNHIQVEDKELAKFILLQREPFLAQSLPQLDDLADTSLLLTNVAESRQ